MKYHPAAAKLSDGAFKLHCRNAYQVLGSELGNINCVVKPQRVSVVICWTSDGKNTGGTGQALRIAEDHKIPILNMYNEKWNTADKVIAYLEEL